MLPLEPNKLVDKVPNLAVPPPHPEQVEVHGDVQDVLHHQHREHCEFTNKGGNCKLIVRGTQKGNFGIILIFLENLFQ